MCFQKLGNVELISIDNALYTQVDDIDNDDMRWLDSTQKDYPVNVEYSILDGNSRNHCKSHCKIQIR